jgi:hypothetical protein
MVSELALGTLTAGITKVLFAYGTPTHIHP